MDDLRPRETGGVGRRLKALLKGRFDPAVAKALLVLVSAVAIQKGSKGRVVRALDALLVASFAHTVNLLDTAPGRAVKWLALWGGVALRASKGGRKEGLASLLSALGAYAPGDLGGLHIMGDSGAYGLGTALGTYLCQAPLIAKLVMTALFVGLSIYAEFGSISKAIKGCPVLRFLDRMGTGRRC